MGKKTLSLNMLVMGFYTVQQRNQHSVKAVDDSKTKKLFMSMYFPKYFPTYRKAHVSELFDETVHDPSLIWLVADLALTTQKQK